MSHLCPGEWRVMFVQLVLRTFQEVIGEIAHNDGMLKGVGSPLFLLIGQL